MIHSDLGTPHLFGATDLGRNGIAAFLRSHKCNDVCRLLHLPENKDFVEENVGQLENSSVNTSFISVAQTKHLAMRAAERKINQREMQARCHLPTDARCHLPTDVLSRPFLLVIVYVSGVVSGVVEAHRARSRTQRWARQQRLGRQLPESLSVQLDGQPDGQHRGTTQCTEGRVREHGSTKPQQTAKRGTKRGKGGCGPADSHDAVRRRGWRDLE